MNSLDQEFQFEKIPKENNKRNKSEVGLNFVSEIWLKNLSNNPNTDSNFISENTVGSIETDNQVLAEDYGQHKVNTHPFGIPADPDFINNDQLPEPGNFTSTVKAKSPLFSKVDDTLCDSSDSYHSAVCSDILENLSDCSGPYEDIEELLTDNGESQDFSKRGVSQRSGNSQKEQSNDWLNSSENETSLNGCSLPPQFSCWEGQEQIFANNHKMELPEQNPGRELNGEIKSFGLHDRNVPVVNSDYKMGVRLIVNTADEKNLFEYEITSSSQEERNACSSDVVGNDSLLTTNNNSSVQGVVNKLSECDLTEMDINLKNCKGNGDQQVHLSITAQNSKTAERSNGVQLTRKQEAEVSIHGSPGSYLQLGLNEPEEMFQIDEFENSFKNDSCVNGKRIHADCMSETSSHASELDETDYEVRKLTAMAFRSLSCPNDNYLHVYNSGGFNHFSPPLAEECHSTNRVSACTEPDCMSAADKTEECPDSSYTVSTLYTGAEESNMLLDDSSDRVQFECVDVAVESQEKGKQIRASRTVPKRQIELRKPQRSELKVFTSSGAINSCAYVGPGVETGDKEETLECLQISESMPYIENTINTNIKNEVGFDKQPQQATSIDGPSPKNKFASCLLTNVISKKMQFEQGLKMEQGLDKPTCFSISPITTFVKKDFALPPIASQQMRHEISAAKSESNNSLDFVDNLKKNGCDDNTEENRSVGQKCSYSSLRCESGLILDGQNKKIIRNCCRTNVLNNRRESNIDTLSEASAERTLELSIAKSCPTLNNLSINAFGKEKNLSVPCTLVGKYINENSQNTEENPDSDDNMQYEVPPYENRTSDIQLSKSSYKINSLSNILALRSPKMLHTSPKAVKRNISCCIPKTLSLAPDSSNPDLDQKNQTLPDLFKFKSGVKKTKVSQHNIKDNLSLKNKAKCPTYVRDMKKLCQNNYSGLTFFAAKAKCDEPEVCNPSSIKQPLPATLPEVSMIDSPWSPIFIQCQSIGRKADIDDNSHVAVDKKYLIGTDSSDTSMFFSSDFKLPIPCNKQENRVTSAKRICSQDYPSKDNKNNVDESLNGLTNIITPERKIQVMAISNNKESKSSFMNVQVEEDAQKISSANFMQNNRITDLVPEENKQQNESLIGLENLNTHSSSSCSAIEDTNYSLTKKESNQEIQSELENKEFSTNSNSNKEDVQVELYKDEPREISERIQNHEDEKAIHTKLEMQNHPLGVICYNNEQVDLSNGKCDPQDGSQAKLKGHKRLFCNSASSNKSTGVSLWKDDTNNNINNRLGNQSECLKISTTNDKETQTPSRKSKHKKELKFKLENQNKMLENLTLDNEGLELLCAKHKLKGGIQVNIKEQNKLIESSALNVKGNKLLLDDAEDKMGEEDNQSKMALESKVGEVSSSENDMQSGLPNETKCLFNFSSNPKEIKLSSIKNNLKGGSDDEVESQNKLPDYNTDIKLQAIKNKNSNLKIESITPQNTDKVENVPIAENVRLAVISELQPKNDNNKILMVSEEEKQNPAKEGSESSNIKTVDEQFSSLKTQVPNGISIPVITTSKHITPAESSNCSETIKISANTPFQETEGQDVDNKLEFSAAIQNAEINKLLASQTPSCFTNLTVKSINSNNPVVKASNGATHDQEHQLSLEMKMLAMNNTVAQEDPSITSAPINYLSIPTEEHKPHASPQIQMPAFPHSFIHKAGHNSTQTRPHQKHWEPVDSHKQEQQTLPHQCLGEILSFDTSLQHPLYASSQVQNQAEPHLVHFASTRQSPDLAEKCYRVPQSPHLMNNPRLPCFQYSEAHKKVLIDPETGKHYFVEAPMQSPRKMLFDPETGCYVEVIIPQHTYGRFYQTSFSPHVLYPNALRPSYIPSMQYSDLISTPLVTYPGPPPGSPGVQKQLHLNRTTSSAMEIQDHRNDMVKNQLAETNYMESTYSTPMSVSVNPNPTQTSTEVISIQSKSCAEVKDNSNVFLSSQKI